MAFLILFPKQLLLAATCIILVSALATANKNVKCVNKSTQGKIKSFKNRMGVDGFLICSKSDGIYRWKNMDGSPTIGESFDPARDCSDIVDNLPEAKDGFYWIALDKNKAQKAWCDVHTDGGGFILLGKKDTPVSWTVPSSTAPVDPNGPAHFSSVFGKCNVQDFAIQISTNKSFKGTRAHWLYRLNPKRELGNLFGLGKGGCTDVHSGIGNVAYVKDILTDTIVTTKFKCSKFGPHVNAAFGWVRMNYCLKNNCPKGYAFIKGFPYQLDHFGSFSYSAVSPMSGITHNSTSFVGCDKNKCCACYGPKGGRKNYCGKMCSAINGGTVTKQAHVWFWIRTRLPQRVWKRCMEFQKKTDDGKVETFFIDQKTGSTHKGTCSKHFHTLLNEGTLTVSDKKSFQKIPPVPGLLTYREDKKQFYVNNGRGWDVLSTEKEVLNLVDKLKKRFEKLENSLLLGCKNAKALGMENGNIRDSQITASSQYNYAHRVQNGRMNFRARSGRTGAWSSRRTDRNQWLQVDFQRSTIITGISTQGRQDSTQFVKSYTISFSNDGKRFHNYKPGGLVKVFHGNSDRDSIVNHVFTPPIEARFIRIHPKTWYSHISMRAEFYDCSY